MRAQGYFLEGLLELFTLRSVAARRASFRESVVSLVRALAMPGPGPFEGVDPPALMPSVRVALADGLLDDLDWLSPASAAVALYELGAILPQGQEKREVGRRLAVYTYEGTANTFAAVAARMALGSGKGLAGVSIRARVALALELPAGVGERVDAMALALASRRELAREWIAKPSRGSLLSRRLASRLLERAASEVARLLGQGNPEAARCFRTEVLGRALADLLSDCEPLVWRHAAIARGILTCAIPELWSELESHLGAATPVTERQRTATSLAAAVAGDPDWAKRRLYELLRTDEASEDPALAGCVLWGLSRAARFEPEIARELASEVVLFHGSSVGEAFEEALREEPSWGAGRTCSLLRRDLSLGLTLFDGRIDDGSAALHAQLLDDLAPTDEFGRRSTGPQTHPVRGVVWQALNAFATKGARQAHELAEDALVMAHEQLSMLEVAGFDATARGRKLVYGALRDLDISVLESAILPNLLMLDRRTTDTEVSVPAVEALRERLCTVLLGWEAEHTASDGSSASIEQRRLRTLIHLLDADTDRTEGLDWRARTVRERWLRAVHTLERRLVSPSPESLERSLAMALARALDGLVRMETCDAVDAMLWIAWHFEDAEVVRTLGEAGRYPELISFLAVYAGFLEAMASERAGGAQSPRHRHELALEVLAQLGASLSGEGSSREEALRDVLSWLSRALSAIVEATSMSDLVPHPAATLSPLAQLEHSTIALAQLVTAARRRIADPIDEVAPRSVTNSASELSRAAECAASDDGVGFASAVAEFLSIVAPTIPGPILALIKAVLRGLQALPLGDVEHSATGHASLAPRRNSMSPDARLPSWIPPSRTVGGYYIVQPIAIGGLGSVFVAKRFEERHDPTGELFALKVPVYDPNAARHVSESEFSAMFQSEATALLALPAHPNIARFVTFDLGAKPKPILVMEFVDGVMLEYLIDTRQMACRQAMRLLDGVLAGLEAMHSVGVGHLDVKPSNIVLRRGEEPVLVDFGLAGRHIRRGCGSGNYCAPEVWGLQLPEEPTPTASDVYSAACIGFEILAGHPLFDQEDTTSLLAAHLAHDGWPAALLPWRHHPALRPVAQTFAKALRRDYRARVTASALRRELASVSPLVEALPWPVLVQ